MMMFRVNNIWEGGNSMFKLDYAEMEQLVNRMQEMQSLDSKMLEGFACSASDNSCGCGWDCSSTKT